MFFNELSCVVSYSKFYFSPEILIKTSSSSILLLKTQVLKTHSSHGLALLNPTEFNWRKVCLHLSLTVKEASLGLIFGRIRPSICRSDKSHTSTVMLQNCLNIILIFLKAAVASSDTPDPQTPTHMC